jgi:hypothetical protein
MKPDEVDKIISNDEGQRTEFKTSFAEEKEAIQTLCAFANAEGGTVLFGVTEKGERKGVSLGHNTLENFANKLRKETKPPLSPSIEQVRFNGLVIVAVTVQKAERGQLYYAFNVPFIRVGRTNQVMTPDEQRVRLLAGVADWSEEKDRPAFEVIREALTRAENNFEPSWRLKQVSGDYVGNLEWRFRGPRFPMEWQHTTGYALDRTNISSKFNLSVEPKEDNIVGLDELALEIRFHWRGRWRHEVHRWPINRKELPTKTLWDVGRERLPPLSWDE